MARNIEAQKEPGTNRRILQNALEALTHPRVDVKDPKAIQARIRDYLQYCMDNDVIPGVAACANWLGVNVGTVEAWYKGTSGSPEHQLVMAQFYNIIQDVWQQNMNEGNINNITGIFMGKAYFGLRDTQEIVVNNRVQNELSVADLIAESKMLPGGDDLIIDGEAKIIEDVKEEKQPQPSLEWKPIKPQKELPQKAQKEDEETQKEERPKRGRPKKEKPAEPTKEEIELEEIKKKSLTLKRSLSFSKTKDIKEPVSEK